MQHIGVAEIEPIDRELEVRRGPDLHAEHLALDVFFGPVCDPNELLPQLGVSACSVFGMSSDRAGELSH